MSSTEINAGAVIVSFNPDLSRIRKVIDAIAAQVKKIVVVDNHSENIQGIVKVINGCNIDFIFNDSNQGIACALNQGMKYLEENHIEWVLTLDQDSICPSNLMSEFEPYTRQKGIGILCPRIRYEGWDSWDDNAFGKVQMVKACMTSASLTCLSVWKEVGGYREEFFIDYVDNDFCEKLKISGYKIVRVNTVIMSHQLGESYEKKIWGLTVRYSHHVSWRYYYMVRNNLIFIGDYKERLNVWKEYGKVAYLMLMGLLFEKEKKRVWKYIRSGIRDARNGRTGEMKC